jgi:glycosyltransferase involved in cell wall biosynthesis
LENFGNGVAEAMIRGLPVVLPREFGAAEIVETSGGGVVVRSGQQDFAASLAGLLHSNE